MKYFNSDESLLGARTGESRLTAIWAMGSVRALAAMQVVECFSFEGYLGIGLSGVDG